jgi:hypothetical protein
MSAARQCFPHAPDAFLIRYGLALVADGASLVTDSQWADVIDRRTGRRLEHDRTE